MLSEQTKSAEVLEGDGRTRTTPMPVREDFASIARAVFKHIHDAMLRLTEAVPGPIRRAVDLQKALNVDAPLAWRVFKIATVRDPLDVVDFVLTSGQILTLIDAAKKKRVPSDLITAIRTSTDAYADLVHEHAGNRESLQMMVATLRPSKTDLIDEKCRRAAFQQHSLIWGQQSETFVACLIACGAPEPEVRTAAIIGHVGFHEVRPGTRHHLTVRARIEPSVASAEIGDTTAPHGDFLQEFCSPDMETEVQAEDADKYQGVRVKLPGLGRRAAMNFFQVFTSTREGGSVDDLQGDINLTGTVLTPSEVMHQDILIPAHEQPRKATARVYGRADNVEGARSFRQADLLPIEATVAYLGPAMDVPPAQGVPNYSQMVQSVLRRQGWYGIKFDVYRCRLPYPIMHTVVNMRIVAADKET